MLDSHKRFYTVDGRRLILIVDDEVINREMLVNLISDEYDTMQAGDGETALELIRENRDTLSLILLDLLMPGIHGLDLIKMLKDDPELRDIPVIVLTSDQEAEVVSLRLGAADFIPKPYPKREIILTRIERTIAIYEDRDILSHTERDELTGLFNIEFFY